jgi:hypothetical protein
MNFYDDSDEKTHVKDTLFSHVGAVIVGLCIGAIATYGMLEPSINHLKAHLAAEQQARIETLMQKPACGETSAPGVTGNVCSPQQQRIDELTGELSRVEKQNVQLIQRAVEQGKSEAEQLNVATVLYEPAAPTAASVTFTVAGRAVALPGIQKMQPRWYVPGKVTPILYGGQTYGPNGAENQYIWVDAQGNHAGPFPARMFVESAPQ